MGRGIRERSNFEYGKVGGKEGVRVKYAAGVDGPKFHIFGRLVFFSISYIQARHVLSFLQGGIR